MHRQEESTDKSASGGVLESDYYRLRSKKLRLSVDDSSVRIDVKVPVSDVVVPVPISDGRVMGRTYGYSDMT